MCALPLEDIFEEEWPRHILPARTECPSGYALLWAGPGKTSYILTEQPRTSLRCLTLLYELSLLHTRIPGTYFSTRYLLFSVVLLCSTPRWLLSSFTSLQQYLTLSHTAVVPGALDVVLHCCTYYHCSTCILQYLLILYRCTYYTYFFALFTVYVLAAVLYVVLNCCTYYHCFTCIYFYVYERPCSGALHCLTLLYAISLLTYTILIIFSSTSLQYSTSATLIVYVLTAVPYVVSHCCCTWCVFIFSPLSYTGTCCTYYTYFFALFIVYVLAAVPYVVSGRDAHPSRGSQDRRAIHFATDDKHIDGAVHRYPLPTHRRFTVGTLP